MKKVLTVLFLLIPVLGISQQETSDSSVSWNTIEKRHFEYIRALVEPAKSSVLAGITEISPEKLQQHRIRQLREFQAKYPSSPHSGEVLEMLGNTYQNNGDPGLALLVYLKQHIVYPSQATKSGVSSRIVDLMDRSPELQQHESRILNILSRQSIDSGYRENYSRYLDLLNELSAPAHAEWALREMDQYLTQFPAAKNTGQVYLWIAELQQSLNRFDDALFTYAKIQYLLPETKSARFAQMGIAMIYRYYLGNPNAAIATLQDLLSNKSSREVDALSTLEIANIYNEALGNYQTALSMYKKVISNYPKGAHAIDARLAMANLYTNHLNQPQEAVDIYMSIPEKHPSADSAAARAFRKAGDLYAGTLRDYFKALETYLEYAIRFPHHQDVPDRLMKAAEITEKRYHDPDMTVNILNVIIDRYPDSAESKKADRRLARYIDDSW